VLQKTFFLPSSTAKIRSSNWSIEVTLVQPFADQQNAMVSINKLGTAIPFPSICAELCTERDLFMYRKDLYGLMTTHTSGSF